MSLIVAVRAQSYKCNKCCYDSENNATQPNVTQIYALLLLLLPSVLVLQKLT